MIDPETSNEPKLTTLELSQAADDAVQELCALLGGVSAGDAIARALGDELFIQRKIADGCKIVIAKDGSYMELVWDDAAQRT